MPLLGPDRNKSALAVAGSGAWSEGLEIVEGGAIVTLGGLLYPEPRLTTSKRRILPVGDRTALPCACSYPEPASGGGKRTFGGPYPLAYPDPRLIIVTPFDKVPLSIAASNLVISSTG